MQRSVGHAWPAGNSATSAQLHRTHESASTSAPGGARWLVVVHGVPGWGCRTGWARAGTLGGSTRSAPARPRAGSGFPTAGAGEVCAVRVMRVWHVCQCHRKVAREWRGGTAAPQSRTRSPGAGRTVVGQAAPEVPAGGRSSWLWGRRLPPASHYANTATLPRQPMQDRAGSQHPPTCPSTFPPAPHEGMAEPDKAGS
jgi:hypothetical protein